MHKINLKRRSRTMFDVLPTQQQKRLLAVLDDDDELSTAPQTLSPLKINNQTTPTLSPEKSAVTATDDVKKAYNL